MKKLVIISLLVLAACSKTNAQGQVINEDTREICHEGVVYVQFDSGQFKWGGAKFNRNGTVVTC